MSRASVKSRATSRLPTRKHRLAFASLDLGKLARKAGDDKSRILPRPGVVERPHAHDGQACWAKY